jgi:hypothetical protein
MSLTSFLQQNQDARHYLGVAFRKPAIPKTALLAPTLTKNPTIVGTAFDYLVRLVLQKINPIAIERRYWVAEGAVVRLPETVQKRGHEIVQDARDLFKDFLNNGEMSHHVISAACYLAQLDIFFRTSRYADQIGVAPTEADVQDLRALLAVLPLDQFRAKTACFLNPTFGDASIAIGGADADLIIDDLLLDIKVRKDGLIHTDDFHQLIGYYLLCQIGGLDGVHCTPTVERLGFYFARYGLLTAWPVAELVGTIPLADSTKWFRDRLGINEIASTKAIPSKRRPTRSGRV